MSIENDTREMSASLSAIWFGRSKIKPQQKSDNINTMFSSKSNKMVSLFFPTATFIFKSLPAYPRSSEWDSSFCSGSSLHGSAHWFWMKTLTVRIFSQPLQTGLSDCENTEDHTFGVPLCIPPRCIFHVPCLYFLSNISKSVTPPPSLNCFLWLKASWSQNFLTSLTTDAAKRDCSGRSDSIFSYRFCGT